MGANTLVYDNIIEANKNTVAVNAIRAYIDENKPLENFLSHYMDYTREYHSAIPGFDPYKMGWSIVCVLQNMTTEEGVCKILDCERKGWISPKYHTIQSYLAGVWEHNDLTPRQIADTVSLMLADANFKITIGDKSK